MPDPSPSNAESLKLQLLTARKRSGGRPQRTHDAHCIGLLSFTLPSVHATLVHGMWHGFFAYEWRIFNARSCLCTTYGIINYEAGSRLFTRRRGHGCNPCAVSIKQLQFFAHDAKRRSVSVVKRYAIGKDNMPNPCRFYLWILMSTAIDMFDTVRCIKFVTCYEQAARSFINVQNTVWYGGYWFP